MWCFTLCLVLVLLGHVVFHLMSGRCCWVTQCVHLMPGAGVHLMPGAGVHLTSGAGVAKLRCLPYIYLVEALLGCSVHSTLIWFRHPSFFFHIVSDFNTLKTDTVSTCWLFWCFHNPPNSNMAWGSLLCVCDLFACTYTEGPQFIVSSKGLLCRNVHRTFIWFRYCRVVALWCRHCQVTVH